MSIEIGSLYRFNQNPERVFVILKSKIETKITMGLEEPVYSIDVLETNGEYSSLFVTTGIIERIA